MQMRATILHQIKNNTPDLLRVRPLPAQRTHPLILQLLCNTKRMKTMPAAKIDDIRVHILKAYGASRDLVEWSIGELLLDYTHTAFVLYVS